jgi:PKD repeat protein/6-phosphogluconolactonase (cycloisomerase 2 family)
VYAPDASGKRLYALPVAVDGALSGIDFLSTAQAPGAMAITPDGTHFYSSMGDGSVTSFSVSPSNGGLTATGTVAFGGVATALAVSPSGDLLVASGGGTVAAYFINADGTLTPAPIGSGASFSDRTVDDIAFAPAGGTLLVAATLTGGAGRLASYSVGADASLDPLDETDAGLSPAAVAVSAEGSRAYVADSAGDQIVGIGIALDGQLSELSGSPYPAADGARSIAISSDGTWLLAASSGASVVSSFRVGSSGGLSASGSSIGVTGVESVVAAPDRRHAYAGGTAKVAALDVSSAGALSIRGAQATTDGTHPALVISPDQAPVARFDSFPAKAGIESAFQADSSFDPDGTIASFNWDFGDGAAGHGPSPTHIYQNPGTYTVTLRAVDNEGCSDAPVYTGHTAACASATATSHTIVIGDRLSQLAPDQECSHDGNDGFCGTPDQKAPRLTILGFNDGASIATVDAPDELVGVVTPDPSGITGILLRFTKSDGTIVTRKTATKRVCHRTRGRKRCRTRPVYKRTCRKVKGKRRCTRKRIIKVIDSKIPACLTVSGTKNYLVKYQCSKVKWIKIAGDTAFRYSIPAALGTGSYTVDAVATDGAGNTDVLETGRNHMTFKIVTTPSNQGAVGGTSGTGGPTTTTPSQPIDDTGSPFG